MIKVIKQLIVSGLLISSTAAYAQDTQFNVRVWADEFNQGAQPNREDWNYELGAGGWGNNELQTYTEDTKNVRIENGKMVIEARNENTITSARLTTQKKHSFKYGRVEARLKLPQGRGTWPAFWMLGENISQYGWPACGEIDIMEYVGYQPGIVHGSLHTPSSYGATVNTSSYQLADAESAFHVYAIEWDEDKIRFFVDDVNFYTYAPSTKNSDTWPFDQEQFIILNLAIGGNWGGAQGVDYNIFPQKYEIDYVRVYQKFNGEVSLEAPTYVQPNAQKIDLQTTDIKGAQYEWILPEGVTITEGAGTSSLKVNWGESGGEVKVKITYDGQVYESSQSVEVKFSPQSTYYFPLTSAQWQVPGEFEEAFELAENATNLEVNFAVDEPRENPYISLPLAGPLDMSAYNKMTVRMKTEQAPNTMRLDLVDANGEVTASKEVFTLNPLNTDGQWHNYVHYFAPNFEHTSMDESAIKELRLYVNYGIYASSASGVIEIEEIQLEVPEEDPSLSAPTDFTAVNPENTIELSWTEANPNEKGYRLYRQSETQDEAVVIAELPLDATSYSDKYVKPQTLYTYTLTGYNQFGETEGGSVQVGTYNSVLSAEEELTKTISFSPNPIEDQLTVSCKEASVLTLYTLQGKKVWSKKIQGEQTLPLAYLEKGMYVLMIENQHERKTFKVLKD